MANAADILAASILIVDDQEANVLLLEQLLRDAGYFNLTATRDPYAVCALHRAHHFDLILLDLQMPGMDGFAVMKDLKANETQGYAPILAITVQPDHKLRALASGAKDFIAKPFDLTEIKTRIHNLIEVRLLYKQLEHTNRELESFALHDELTQLPNRRLLLDRLKQARLSSARTRRHCALMFMDVDHFKQINDSLGHDVGDELLQQVSARLLKCAREGDSVARFGGDEFVLLLDGLSTHAAQAAVQAEGMAHKMHDALSETYSLQRHSYDASFSIGMVIFVGETEPIADLLKKADLAMYQVKADGRNGVRFFDPVMQAQAQAHDLLAKELHNALAQQQFEVYYQVQVNAQGQSTGAQALLRWNHPVQGVLSPSDFVQLAEDTGMQQPLGQWLLERACQQLHAWAQQPQTASWSIAVSLADCQWAQIDCVSQVTTALQSANANPHLLMLGLSEHALAAEPLDAIAKMNALRDCGVRFSLDDFGNAWPALSHLQQLPLDQLKLSRSLVSNLQRQASDAVMLQSIVALAASLKLQVLAQGVDTTAQYDMLLAVGCGAFQGDLFGPVAALNQLPGKYTENLPLALIKKA